MTELNFNLQPKIIALLYSSKLKTSEQKQHKSIKHTFGQTSSKFANEKANNFYVNVNIYR